jgi:hypothetical protein
MGAATRITSLLASATVLAGGLSIAPAADAASLSGARHAVKVRVLKRYGAAGLTVRVQCKQLRRNRFGCSYVAPARTRKTMVFWGNALVTYRGKRAKVRLIGGGCLGRGCRG